MVVTISGVLTLTINKKQRSYPDTAQYNKEIAQSAAGLRVEMMIILHIYIHSPTAGIEEVVNFAGSQFDRRVALSIHNY